jgi:hypothetical protein
MSRRPGAFSISSIAPVLNRIELNLPPPLERHESIE